MVTPLITEPMFNLRLGGEETPFSSNKGPVKWVASEGTGIIFPYCLGFKGSSMAVPSRIFNRKTMISPIISHRIQGDEPVARPVQHTRSATVVTPLAGDKDDFVHPDVRF